MNKIESIDDIVSGLIEQAGMRAPENDEAGILIDAARRIEREVNELEYGDPMATMKHRVFVYGTLKRGHGNHHILEKAEFIGAGRTVENHRLYDSGFPVLRPRSHDKERKLNAPVRGEVYAVDEQTLERLDRLEGEGRMYHRMIEWIRLDDGRKVTANLYVGTESFARRLRPYAAPKGAYSWPCKKGWTDAAE